MSEPPPCPLLLLWCCLSREHKSSPYVSTGTIEEWKMVDLAFQGSLLHHPWWSLGNAASALSLLNLMAGSFGRGGPGDLGSEIFRGIMDLRLPRR